MDALSIKVELKSKLDELNSRFDCFTRPDLSDEIIIDLSGIVEDDELFNALLNVLDLDKNSEFAEQLRFGGYTIFHA